MNLRESFIKHVNNRKVEAVRVIMVDLDSPNLYFHDGDSMEEFLSEIDFEVEYWMEDFYVTIWFFDGRWSTLELDCYSHSNYWFDHIRPEIPSIELRHR